MPAAPDVLPRHPAGQAPARERSLFAVLFLSALALYLAGFLLERAHLYLPEGLLNVPPPTSLFGIVEHDLRIDYATYGFVRRGLVGTLLLVFPAPWRVPAAEAAFFAVDAAVLLSLSGFLAKALPGFRSGGAWVAALAVLSPLSVIQFGLSYGRYDHIGILMLILSLIAVARHRLWLAAVPVCVALLVHEAFLLYGLPAILFCHLARRESPESLSGIVSFAIRTLYPLYVPALATVAALILFGDPQVDPVAPPPTGSWNRPLLQPVEPGWRTALVPAVLVYCTFRVFGGLFDANGRLRGLSWLGAVPALLLFAVGIDAARWTGLIYCYFLAAFLFAALARGYDRGAPASTGWRVHALPLLALPLGPVGIVQAFPIVDNFLTLIARLGLS